MDIALNTISDEPISMNQISVEPIWLNQISVEPILKNQIFFLPISMNRIFVEHGFNESDFDEHGSMNRYKVNKVQWTGINWTRFNEPENTNRNYVCMYKWMIYLVVFLQHIPFCVPTQPQYSITPPINESTQP